MRMDRLVPLLILILDGSPGLDAGTLRVVTVDGTTRKPIPARVSVRGPDGSWRWGLDARGQPLQYGGLPRLWSTGTVELELSAGQALVIASRPYARLPASAEVTVAAAGSATVVLALEPVVDLRALGWYGGDAHTHVVHGERHFAMDLPLAALIAKGEGLDWAAFGEVWTSLGDVQPAPARRAELCRAASDDSFLCAWTREHPKDHLGHMAAFPLGVDGDFGEAVGANRYEGSLETREEFTHFEILRALRGAGTLAVYTHPTREYGGVPESPANIARELPFDAVAAPWALEALDVLTDAPQNASNLKLWRFLLDRGHRLAACGFSDACYDRRGERPGDTRTYVRLDGAAPTMPGIIEAVRRGRTFATTGPLVTFDVDGVPASAALPADGRRREARVRAFNAVDHGDPREPAFVEKIEVLRNGQMWKQLGAESRRHEMSFTFAIEEKETAWYVVQVQGSHPGQFAVTSPLYFEGPGPAGPPPSMAVVRGEVTGPGGRPLRGEVRAVEYGKGHFRVVSQAPLEEGRYRIRCPAECRIQAVVEGYRPGLKSIFLDFDRLYRDLFWPMRQERMWDPKLYSEIERRLSEVVLDFQLEPR